MLMEMARFENLMFLASIEIADVGDYPRVVIAKSSR